MNTANLIYWNTFTSRASKPIVQPMTVSEGIAYCSKVADRARDDYISHYDALCSKVLSKLASRGISLASDWPVIVETLAASTRSVLYIEIAWGLWSQIKWGFDYVSFQSREQWGTFLERHGIDPVAHKDNSGWCYGDDTLKIVTLYDPCTGEHSYYSHTVHPDIGFAGCVGIEGDRDKVLEVAENIRAVACIKTNNESPYEREFI